MDFSRDTFPLAVYGLRDVFSGFILFLKIWTSNSDPKLIGRWYWEHINNSKVVSKYLRVDKGTENGHMATIHAYLNQQREDVENVEDTVYFSPSTNNKIERWWRELYHRLKKFFKRQLRILLEQGHYDSNNETDRENLLAYVFIPVIQQEMDIFRSTIWNSYRVRHQRDAQMPKGVPNHLYSFPEAYGAEECGTQVALNEVAEMSGVLTVGDDFLAPNIRAECR
ncbi:uncharacterized protein LOC114535309 [Dendronephthya gigantea]|uniref:uncharacterized protein LOC114535309 n=1 Tax=Dendronephthya gigantea TaxID=151771 RepID=UPI00106AEFCE|nr:uncharacterized protein LOC114535309 [Dendronephthya gigantea]